MVIGGATPGDRDTNEKQMFSMENKLIRVDDAELRRRRREASENTREMKKKKHIIIRARVRASKGTGRET